jgi:hypothetical protein
MSSSNQKTNGVGQYLDVTEHELLLPLNRVLGTEDTISPPAQFRSTAL